MELFHEIPDELAIIRLRGGVYKQAKLYRRGDLIFVGASGGYLRVLPKFGDTWGTSHPNTTVIDMSEAVARLVAQRKF